MSVPARRDLGPEPSGSGGQGTKISCTPPRVALIGASGHGLWHRRQIARLAGEGRVELVGLCDVRPVAPAPDAPLPEGLPTFTDHAAMLAGVRPDVVVICTPPHTHLPIAVDALRAGADVLLEKPPVLSMAEHRELGKVIAETGRACQIGFQALGSAALAELFETIAAGRLGDITGIAAVASWRRDDAYWARSPWAGRRTVNGRPSLDGALANPLAHALMQSLAVAAVATGGPALPGVVELERYRTRPIEVDDTACLRTTVVGGLPVVVAVTLCGEDFIAGEIIVSGSRGTAVLEYPTDRLLLPPGDGWRDVPGRRGLLENLLDHRADPAGVELIAPLSRTAPFTALLEVISGAPEPADVDPAYLARSTSDAGSRVNVITGVNAALREAGRRLALPSELGVPWARAPYVTNCSFASRGSARAEPEFAEGDGKRTANSGDT